MSLPMLFEQLAKAFNGPAEIERIAAQLLRAHAAQAHYHGPAMPLPASVQAELDRPEAHPCCALIKSLPFNWVPPQTSSDPAYIAHSASKVHVELLGPDGLVPSDQIRLGLYGIGPNAEYGLRTHPAEEIFVMLAGEADWMRGDAPYVPHQTGERSHHASMLPHATRTRARAFMSVYAWIGDISTEGYRYAGLPDAASTALAATR